MDEESCQVIFDVAEYIYNYAKGKIPIGRLVKYLETNDDINLDELYTEAARRALISKNDQRCYIKFPIEYVRDILLFALYIRRRRIPINKLKFISTESYHDMYNFEAFTEENIPKQTLFVDEVNRVMPIVGSKDGNILYAGIVFNSDSLPFKNAMSCIYIGSMIHIGYTKENDTYRFKYFGVKYTGITGFDRDFPDEKFT